MILRRMPARCRFELSQRARAHSRQLRRLPRPEAGVAAGGADHAAHSVLVVADTNVIEIHEDGTLGRGPATVRWERAEEAGAQWMVATHDGYVSASASAIRASFISAPRATICAAKRR